MFGCFLIQFWLHRYEFDYISLSLLNEYLWYDKLWGPSQRVVTLFLLNCFLMAALAPIDTICLLSSKDTTAQKECKHLLSEYTHYFHISNNCRQLSLLLLLFTQTVFVSMIWWLPLEEKVVCENCRRAIPDIKGVSTLPQKCFSTLPGHFCKTNLPRFLMDLSDDVGWSILGFPHDRPCQ